MNACHHQGATAARLLTATLLAASLVASTHAAESASPKERLAKAQAMFTERCKTAGEKIYRTVDNVEGVYLLKLRPSQNFAAQFVFNDPYGLDFFGDAYIRSFLKGHYSANRTEPPIAGSPPRPIGYSYVEAIDPKDGKRYHYTGRLEEPWQYNKAHLKGDIRFVMDKTLATGEPPRYGVTYDDISTHEEREYWIAGSSLKVIDLRTNEVIGERVGYMMDPGQGSRGGGRGPWLEATDHACPSFMTNPNHLPGPAFAATDYQTDLFVEKVLRPTTGQTAQ